MSLARPRNGGRRCDRSIGCFTIPLRLQSLFRWAQADQELDDELRDHLERKTEEYLAQGMTQKEAHRRARLDLGGIEQTKEKCRDARQVKWIQDLIEDLRFGLRVLRKSPGFTTVAALTLALGIGANTAIFSIVNGVLLRSLPVPHADEIVSLANEQAGNPLTNTFSVPDITDIASQGKPIFSAIFGYQPGSEGVRVGQLAQPILIEYVTGNFFSALGVKPRLGRLILPREGAVAGADPVLVLGYSYWKTRFGGDPGIIGKRVEVNGTQVMIVGVAPKGFRGTYSLVDAQGYLPLGMLTVESWWQSHDFLHKRALRNTVLFARLRPGVTLQQAQSALSVVGRRLTQEYPDSDQSLSLFAYPERFARPGPASAQVIVRIAFLFLLLGFLILVLACTNLANLLLVRSAGRQHEMGIRASLGARRGRLIRQLLTEAIALGLVGGVAGIMAGMLASRELASIHLSADIPVSLDFPFDWHVFTFAFILALLTGALAGIMPALRLSESNLAATTRQAGRSLSARQRVRHVFVVVQISGALGLIIMAGLLTRSLTNAERVDLGFDPSHIVNFGLDPHQVGYDAQQGIIFNRQLLTRVRALPGISSASLAAFVAFSYVTSNEDLQIPGHPVAPDAPAPLGWDNYISPDYFRTMDIPIIAGRDFTDADDEHSQPVAIINQAMAAQFWPGENAIGRTFTYGTGVKITVHIVGIVKDSRFLGLAGPIPPSFYIPDTQTYLSQETLQVRTIAAPSAIEREIQSAVETIAPGMPVFHLETMEQAMDTLQGILLFRFGASVGLVLGLLGLSLAVVGIYGVISYSTSQRTHEIAIRMALGAQRRTILAMVISQGVVLLVVGLAIGLMVATSAAHYLGGLLLGVKATDLLTYLSASLIVSILTLAACYIPARRTTGVDPMVALRYE